MGQHPAGLTEQVKVFQRGFTHTLHNLLTGEMRAPCDTEYHDHMNGRTCQFELAAEW